MIKYRLKIEPTEREIVLVNALRDLQAMYCDTVQKYEPGTDIFTDAGYVESQAVLDHFYSSVKEKSE